MSSPAAAVEARCAKRSLTCRLTGLIPARKQDSFRLADNSELFIRAGNRILEHGLDYFFSRIDGVKVMPTSNPSGAMKRLTVWPHGSFLFLISIRYPRASRCDVSVSTLSTSNSTHACGAGMSSGQESLPKQDCAA